MQCKAWTLSREWNSNKRKQSHRCTNSAKEGEKVCGVHLLSAQRKKSRALRKAANQRVTGGRGFRLDKP